jgi:hypothetical protein
MMGDLLVQDLGAVRKALARAARTDASTAKYVVPRFVEIQPGIAQKLEAERHQLLTGRRGTGKSTILEVVQHDLRASGVAVASLDMEVYKGRQYPDVLIEILIALTRKLRPKLAFKGASPKKVRDTLILQRRVDRLFRVLTSMLNDPQKLQKTLTRNRSSTRSAGVDAAITATFKAQAAKASASARKESALTETAEAQFEELKIERLQILAGNISALLADVVSVSAAKTAVVFLDDYYFVPLLEQPVVLDYLHQAVKGTGVWLKVGGVGSRLNTYTDGAPPVGMEVGQDLSAVAIDVTLAEFATAQRFLEEVVDGVLKDFDVSTHDLFTSDARSRMVLASGGAVARDYITLTESAIDQAIERMNKSGKFGKSEVVKIWTVDVQSAVKGITNTKEKEAFKRDADTDASALSTRWADICDFSRKTGDVFMLVPQAELEREPWGQEVLQLENLRLIHRIGDTTPNAKSWQGVKVTVFMIDLGQLPTVRLSKKIPEFWSSAADFNNLRRASWVYTPAWRVA